MAEPAPQNEEFILDEQEFMNLFYPVMRPFLEHGLQLSTRNPGCVRLQFHNWFSFEIRFHTNPSRIIEIEVTDISLSDETPPPGLTGTVVLQFAFALGRHCQRVYRGIFPEVCMTLYDASHLQFITPDGVVLAIPFYMLRLLAYGESWYNSHGFVARDADELKPDYDYDDGEKIQLNEIRGRLFKEQTGMTIGELAALVLNQLKTFPKFLESDEQARFVRNVRTWVLRFLDERYENHVEYDRNLIYVFP